MSTPSIDSVLVKMGSGFNRMGVREFLTVLSKDERIKLIIDKRVQFLDGAKIVDTKTALPLLKKHLESEHVGARWK
jgi:hypothetical protein